MKRILLISCLLLWRLFSAGETIVWNSTKESLSIGRQVDILEDKTGAWSIDQVSSLSFSNRFIRSEKNVLHFGFTQSVFWLRFTLDNHSPQNLVLEIAHAFLPYTDLYYRDDSGRWVTLHGGYKVNMDQKKIKYHFPVFPLPGGDRTFYVRLISYSHPIPVRIWNQNAFEKAADRQILFYGLYGGILLFVIIINVFLYFSLGKFYYLHYAALVLLYLATAAAVMEGFIVYLFPHTDLMKWYITVPALNMPVLLSYCISFLELKKYSRKLFYIGLFGCAYYCLYLIWMHWLPLMTILLVNQIHAFSLFLLVTAIGIIAGKEGNKLGYYFATAYSIWFILVAIEAIYIQSGSPAYLFGISYVSISIFAEVFLLAWLLAKRFQWEMKHEQQVRIETERNLSIMQQHYDQQILQARLEIQENTFTKISEEIHDNIGQILTVAKIHLGTLDWNNFSEAMEKIADAREQVSRAIVDLRDMSKTLNSENIQSIGFSKAIATELQLIKKSGLIQVNHTVKGAVVRSTDPVKELILFRIAQEALQNVIRHAKASHLTVELSFEDYMLDLSISDDGQGFDTSGPSSGSGLHNMQSRSLLIGATLTIESKPGAGTRVHIELPLTSYDG